MNMELFEPFSSSTREIIKEMAGLEIVGLDIMENECDEITSMGASSIITFAGKIKGRLFVDMDPGLALYLTNTILEEEYKELREKMVLSMISEINNIISGNAITYINNNYAMNIRLAPPVVFAGKDVIVSIPKIKSKSTWGNTQYGRIRINVAWERIDD